MNPYQMNRRHCAKSCRSLLQIVLVLLCLHGSRSVQANTLFVQLTGSDSNNGSSWQQAKRTVKATLSVAQAGDQIWVAAGTYTENITLLSGVALYGGFTGIETSLSQRNWSVDRTILDGNKAGTVVASGVNSSTRLDGFIVQNGSNSGISCQNASPTIINDVIQGNSGSDGGGITCSNRSFPATIYRTTRQAPAAASIFRIVPTSFCSFVSSRITPRTPLEEESTAGVPP